MVNLLGFNKIYSQALFIILTTPTALFALVHLKVIPQTRMCPDDPKQQYSAHGTCYYEEIYPTYRTSMFAHLASILPASLLACLQFVPKIRQKYPAVHRWTGRICNGLSFVGTIACFTMSRYSLGASSSSWTAIWVFGLIFLGTIIMGTYSAKMSRWENHRVWMLRAWSYGASVITLRTIYISLAYVSPYLFEPFHAAMPCAQMSYLVRNDTELVQKYPACHQFVTQENPNAQAVVKGSFTLGDDGDLVEMSAFGHLWLGSSTWLALAVHAILTEVYLNFTSDEHERLKKFSDYKFKKQSEKTSKIQ